MLFCTDLLPVGVKTMALAVDIKTTAYNLNEDVNMVLNVHRNHKAY